MGIDADAVGAGETAVVRERILGQHADADDHEVGAQHRAVAQHDTRDTFALAFERGHRRERAQVCAEPLVRGGEEPRDRRRHRAAHDAGRRFDDRHRFAGPRRRRGKFKADEARADDDDRLRGVKIVA